jgi:fructose-bisphosphate aldolase class 1
MRPLTRSVENTEENRRFYREILFTAPDIEVSDVCGSALSDSHN